MGDQWKLKSWRPLGITTISFPWSVLRASPCKAHPRKNGGPSLVSTILRRSRLIYLRRGEGEGNSRSEHRCSREGEGRTCGCVSFLEGSCESLLRRSLLMNMFVLVQAVRAH